MTLGNKWKITNAGAALNVRPYNVTVSENHRNNQADSL
jgi:hypothetical protein